MMILTEHAYFQWLRDRVEVPVPNGKSWEGLIGQLHSKEFVWVIPNDDNRLHDAVDLRREFSYEYEVDTRQLMLEIPISVLEVIIALSVRIEFQVDGRAGQWAWTLIDNLGLAKFVDPVSPRMSELIDDTLDTFIWRNYKPSGEGGLFPLKNPHTDQRKVELWYQMHAWLAENFTL